MMKPAKIECRGQRGAGARQTRGYYIRARAVDHCVRDFLLKTQGCPRTQIVSLGAGFDSLFFRLKDMGLLHGAVVYEVDFPSVARQKAALIKRTKELSALVGDAGGEELGVIAFSGEDYKLLGVDLSELSELERALEGAGLDSETPTLFIAEVVLTYMENSRSDALIQWAADRFPRACFVLYEQVQPRDPFGRVMQRHFSQRRSALRSLAQYPDCGAQHRRFSEKGWTECSVMDMNEFFTRCTPQEERQRVQALEPFDEYEEWHLKCSHYFVLAASKGMEPSWTPLLPSLAADGDGPVRTAGTVTATACALPSQTGLRRYGHRSVLIEPNVILTTGGFGEEDGQHCRMRQFNVLIKHAGCWKAGCVKTEHSGERWDGRLYHTVSRLSNTLALVTGGRTSPSGAGLGMLWLKFPECCSDPEDFTVELVGVQRASEPAARRWRHSATEVVFQGEKYLFVYGGRSAVEPALGDWRFLHAGALSCAVVPVEGPAPEGRHSHSACGWNGGVLIAGGLGAAERPLGSVLFLRALERGFRWQTVETRPPLIPRYSHTAHVHDGKLLLVGGVWFRSSSVPGVTVIDLLTGLCLDYAIDVEHLEWPLMLHNHSSVFLPNEKELLLIGGGGNCFSFGTHLNAEPVVLSLSGILASGSAGPAPTAPRCRGSEGAECVHTGFVSSAPVKGGL
ncbi:tRNA wybutosine-synthesizing protein 4 isoform X2 [Patagioenas fasciata]|uniref:tRNA wybutosine-synthesizing protein 4 isoform X2 n=1 Tax=Patagioenas fasciata TaxID=372321 RepID=UPI003A99BB8A